MVEEGKVVGELSCTDLPISSYREKERGGAYVKLIRRVQIMHATRLVRKLQAYFLQHQPLLTALHTHTRPDHYKLNPPPLPHGWGWHVSLQACRQTRVKVQLSQGPTSRATTSKSHSCPPDQRHKDRV